jgi:hypothetical protein
MRKVTGLVALLYFLTALTLAGGSTGVGTTEATCVPNGYATNGFSMNQSHSDTASSCSWVGHVPGYPGNEHGGASASVTTTPTSVSLTASSLAVISGDPSTPISSSAKATYVDDYVITISGGTGFGFFGPKFTGGSGTWVTITILDGRVLPPFSWQGWSSYGDTPPGGAPELAFVFGQPITLEMSFTAVADNSSRYPGSRDSSITFAWDFSVFRAEEESSG